MQEKERWMVEDQSDGEEAAYRILEISGNKATLRYIAMEEKGATDLITALNWLDTFRKGIIPGQTPSPKKRARKKPEHLVVQLELEPLKPSHRKPKS